MSRAATTTLVGIAVFGLSCSVTEPSGEDFAPIAALPSVAAAPSPTEAPDADLVAGVAARIRSQRRVSLTEPEINAVARTIVAESRRHAIDPNLVLAVIHVESRFDAYAVSTVGALGLMQILPSTGAALAVSEGIDWVGPQTLFDPIVNVRLGIAYLNEMANRYRDTAMALAAYNWGPGHIDRRLRLGTPMPTVYPDLVFRAYSRQRQRRS